MPLHQGIHASALVRTFGSIRAASDISLNIAPGTVTGILGPNGSGKSTTLRMLCGLVRPDSGTATVAGAALLGDGTAVRKVSTFAPGEIALYGEMKGGEHLEWLLRGRPQAAIDHSRAIAKQLGLPPDKKVHAYSHGMKRQLLFAAAMGPDVPVRILDEPTEGLDPAKRQEVLDLIAADAKAGNLVLLSSHHLSEVQAVCERLVFFHAGKIIADESPAKLATRARRTVLIEYMTADEASLAQLVMRREIGEGSSNPTIADCAAADLEVHVTLLADDSRDFLIAFANLDAPASLAITIGRLSLTDLYRTVYGVSGL
jgi:ABC-2 type transport system ATP-binding protein